MSRWIDAAAMGVCAGLLLTTACGKKEAPQANSEHATASAKVTASASASSATAQSPSPGVTKGEALLHMPKECKQGRVYVDAAALTALAGDALNDLETTAASVMGPGEGEKAKKALAVLKAGGFDPATSVKELAVCVNGDDDVVFAMGLDLSRVKGDPLDLLVRAVEATGEKNKPAKKRDGSLSYLVPKDGDAAISILGSSLVVGKDLKALQAAQKGGGEAGFKDATKALTYVDVTVEQGRIAGTLVDVGSDLKVVGSMKMTGKAGANLKKSGDAAIQQMKRMVDEMAGELAKTPFKALVEPLKALKLTANGDTLNVELVVPKKGIQNALQETGKLKPEELMQMLK